MAQKRARGGPPPISSVLSPEKSDETSRGGDTTPDVITGLRLSTSLGLFYLLLRADCKEALL